MKDNLKALEKEIVVKNNEIKEVILRLENSVQSMIPPVSKISNAPFTQPQSLLSTTLSTHTLVTTDTPSSIICSLDESDIPQLDGQFGAAPTYEIKCENCGKNFETENMLKNHIDTHEWGCDDCTLCFTSKYFADMHELEKHNDTPDSINYIRDHIPETTKRLFAARHHQR